MTESTPLTRDQVMPLLVAACPSFGPTWERLLDEEDDDGRVHYVDSGDFIRHLVDLVLEDRTDELPAVFEVIERLVIEGDPYVNVLAIIGYLEGLQMRAVTNHGIDPEVTFRPYFWPQSELAWIEINRSWDAFFANRHREHLRSLLHWNAYRVDPSPAETADAPGGDGILGWAELLARDEVLPDDDVAALIAATEALTADLSRLSPEGSSLRAYYDNLVEIGRTAVWLTAHGR